MNFNIFLISVTALSVTLFGACHNAHQHEAHEGEHTDADEHGHNHGADEITFTEAQAKAAELQITTLRPTTFAEVIEVTGQVLPATGSEATVTATMAGIVKYASNALTEGCAVGNGNTLFVVNGKPMADGNPAAVAQSELDAAKSAYERAQKLATEHIIAQRELEDARQRYQAAAATAQSLGNAAQSRGISAPIGGYIKDLLVKPGDYEIGRASCSLPICQPLATITQSQHLQLRADVPERYYRFLADITSANFRLTYQESAQVVALSTLGGRLVSKGKSTATNGNFVPVIFEFNNRGNIVAGSMAQIYLQGKQRHGVLAVPTEALTEAQGLYFVYVQEHADSYRRQEVKIGATDGLRTEIVSGVKAGDKVVTHGATQVRLAASSGAVPEGHSH